MSLLRTSIIKNWFGHKVTNVNWTSHNTNKVIKRLTNEHKNVNSKALALILCQCMFSFVTTKKICVLFDINFKKRKTTHISALLGSLWQLLLKTENHPSFKFWVRSISKAHHSFFLSHAKQQLFDVYNNWEAHTSCKYFHKVSYICQVQFKNYG